MNTTRAFIAITIVLALAASVRVANTWRVFSETLDEPLHLAAGYEYLTGPYTIDLQHPPLARALSAAPLVLAGAPKPAAVDVIEQGNELLYWNDRYEKTLARVRAPNLLFLMIAIGATAAWARRAFDRPVSLLATLFFTSLPPVLAHAGVATTDMALTAAIPLALLALDTFLDRPSLRRALFLGAAIAFGVLAKMSFLIYFPAALLVVVVVTRPWRREGSEKDVLRWRSAMLAVLAAAFFITWAGYKFDFGKPAAVTSNAADVIAYVSPESARPAVVWIAEHVPMPAPALVLGIAHLAAHDQEGHGAYLFGKFSPRGWWYYFPVVFFYKTPIPFLLLAAWGTWLIAVSGDRRLLSFVFVPLAIMLVAMNGSINIGVRHVLPIYAPLSIVAAYGAAMIWRRSTDAFGRTAVVALVAWLVIGTGLAHPDYLPWFNEAAGAEPSRIAVDSNLDWGQDTLRLSRVLREMQLTEIHLDYWTNVELERHGVNRLWVNPLEKTSGWVAVGETPLALARSKDGHYKWLSTYRPVRTIGKTIRLYYIP